VPPSQAPRQRVTLTYPGGRQVVAQQEGGKFYSLEGREFVPPAGTKYASAPPGQPQTTPSLAAPIKPPEEPHRKRKGEEEPSAPGGPRIPGTTIPDTEVGRIAHGIIIGRQPPVLTGLYRLSGPVREELDRQGYDLVTATRDWTAIQAHMKTLNGPQQLRLQQSVDFVWKTLPQVEEAFRAWQETGLPSGFRAWNKAALLAATNLPGEAGARAQNLLRMINDMTSEVATMYSGGGAATDDKLRLAGENLRGDWNEKMFERNIAGLKQSVRYRYKSIMESSPAGVSPHSPYLTPEEHRRAGGLTTEGEEPKAKPAPAPAPAKPGRVDKQTEDLARKYKLIE
jgi:hypothetical protein